MSRHTKLNQITKEGFEEHFASENESEDLNIEEEEIIEEFIQMFDRKFKKKEILKVLDQNDWNEDDATHQLEEMLKKKNNYNKKKINYQKKKQKIKNYNKLEIYQQKKDKINKSNNNINSITKLIIIKNKIIKIIFNNNNQLYNKSNLLIAQMKKTVKQAKQYIQKEIQIYTIVHMILSTINQNQIKYKNISKNKSTKNNKYKKDLQNLNLIIIGHVDSGKSTLIGHLCYLKGLIDSKQAHKNEKESKNIGKESFKYAWANDEFDAERQRGVTIDIGFKVLYTKNKIITFLDAPGHKDFVPNMIQGATQADYALLVVDGFPNSFMSGFDLGGQTKEHAYLVRSLGVVRIIVVINKMDLTDWNENDYNYVCTLLNDFLVKIDFDKKNIIFVPISAFQGENIVQKTNLKQASWYNGLCLMDLLDQLQVPDRNINTPLRMNIYNTYFQKNKGLFISGKIEGGVIFEKSKALIMPQGLVVFAKDIYKDNIKSEYAYVGDNIELVIQIKEQQQEIRSGNVLCSIEYPIPTTNLIDAEFVAFELIYPILKGAQVIVYINTAKSPGFIKKVYNLIDKNSGDILKKNPKYIYLNFFIQIFNRCIRSHDCAQIQISIEKSLCAELYSNYRAYGRVIIREQMNTLGVGMITKIY
ncbi:hypothetical protein IMG5_187290 [Ichthyophthirius multifiliis]|uniref:Tr-type G domain-containing protein n=1 Tax=Ichthyophthirius multifiliis TaxID=5932 RepID=G0R3R8_ICHMU|nr:hypothetical protein IMG5_187290 [Ichthyophthirius multifiliis]EGR27885.1 hypothetical protein IMG5_187290 [Ichthyophthirius multifiliis]|eukprot:XP_004027230.1 hypothetical protein IMG5_187290 [Ichthyophthirius multifiliis]